MGRGYTRHPCHSCYSTFKDLSKTVNELNKICISVLYACHHNPLMFISSASSSLSNIKHELVTIFCSIFLSFPLNLQKWLLTAPPSLFFFFLHQASFNTCLLLVTHLVSDLYLNSCLMKGSYHLYLFHLHLCLPQSPCFQLQEVSSAGLQLNYFPFLCFFCRHFPSLSVVHLLEIFHL